MKKFIIFILLLSFYGCSKPKTVLICGDHICINKTEAKQYFEDNLTIEVKIIDKKKNNKIDLVQLNLKENLNDKKQINIYQKEKTNEHIKILTDDEVKKIKKEIILKKKKKKIVKKIDRNDKKFDLKNKIIETKRNYDKDVVDVCSILNECNIEEISKYLLKEGKKRSFPDINIRE
tara:strand:- start:3929 stop:4456 length:528 start_codon:yes stop_codon:yes gene_type:complete